MRAAALLCLPSGCTGRTVSLMVPPVDAGPQDASSPDSSSDAARLDAHEFDAFTPDVDPSSDVDASTDASSDDAHVAIDAGSDAGPSCSVVTQTGCEATPDYACRFSDPEEDAPGTGAPECIVGGSLPERGALPGGSCFTRELDATYFDLCGPGFFCGGESLGCRRYCDPDGAPCAAYTGPVDGCNVPAGGCPQTCNSTSTPIASRPPFAFPGGVGYCESE